MNKIQIFQCIGEIVYVEFQRYPLKFHTESLTNTLKSINQSIERYEFYSKLKFYKLWDLRAHKCFWPPPPRTHIRGHLYEKCQAGHTLWFYKIRWSHIMWMDLDWDIPPCNFSYVHDDVIKWKYFPRYWPFVRGIQKQLWAFNSKSSLICTCE